VYIDFTQKQQLMSSQIKSDVEYLIQTYNIRVLILYTNGWKI